MSLLTITVLAYFLDIHMELRKVPSLSSTDIMLQIFDPIDRSLKCANLFSKTLNLEMMKGKWQKIKIVQRTLK